MDHEHQWTLYLADAAGYYSKRGDGTDSIRMRGRVMRCADVSCGEPCSLFLFVPHNPELFPVEAVAA